MSVYHSLFEHIRFVDIFSAVHSLGARVDLEHPEAEQPEIF